MNQKLLLTILLHLITLCLFSTTLEVNLDGTTPYTTIQSAIDASLNGDTVLVHQGTYYENINFDGKSITLASMFLTTLDEYYIDQTVIDGNQDGKVVRIELGEEVTINGLTITNGKVGNINNLDGAGSGIFVSNSSLQLTSSIISNNIANNGGGVCVINSDIDIRGVTIKENFASISGGGLCSISSNINFNENHRSSIFLNSAISGSDIYLGNHQGLLTVFADTLTVTEPDLFFCCSVNNYGITNQIIVNQLNPKITPVDTDIYVSPNGNDSNDGLTDNTPLKTIRQSLIITSPNSSSPNKIILLPGIYSENTNGEHFPITLRDFTSIEGVSSDDVILNAAGTNSFVDMYSLNSSINKVTISNGYNSNFISSFYKWDNLQTPNNRFDLRDVIISNSSDEYGVQSIGDLNVGFENVVYTHNQAPVGGIANFTDYQLSHDITNCIFRYNLGFLGVGSRHGATLRDSIKIINSLFENNYDDNIEWGFGGPALAIGSKSITDIVNCTFTDNIFDHPDNGGAILVNGSIIDINFYNSILYGNTPYNVYVLNENADWPIGLDIDYSLVENGEESIYAPLTSFNYGGNNLDTDPLFMGDNALFPYALSSESPCIDAGTLDLPEWIELPETDLAGNPRISGESIDMGCYEYTEFTTPINLEIDEQTGVLFWSPPNYEYPVSYKLFLNDEYIASVSGEIYQYNFSSHIEENDSCRVGVSAVYTTGESSTTELEFIYNPVFGENNEVELVETRITNYPNPFNPSSGTRGSTTTIKFELAESGRVDLAIYNIKGQKVTMLMDAWSEIGVFEMEWDGRDDYGKSVASGEYFIKLKQGNKVTLSKLLVLK